MGKLLSKLFIPVAVMFALGVFGFAGAGQVRAQSQGAELISDYQTEITVASDSTIQVVETITYDFGATQRHGIIRDIPYKYKARGGTFKLRMDDFAVTDAAGEAVNFSQSSSGGEVHLKIGDADKLVTGQQVYKIAYTVRRAVNYFDTHDELYWNAIGTGWDVPILKGGAVIHGPAVITQTECYTGPEGSEEKKCTMAGGNTSDVTFTATEPLAPGFGLTVVAGFPAGTLQQPTTGQKLWDIFLDNGILLLPLVVLVVMFALWYRYGRDPKQKNAIVAQYEAPDNLSAIYMGSLIHNGTTNQDLAGEIVWLATQGYISIKRLETEKMLVFKGQDYEFTQLDKSPAGLPKQSAALLDALFTGGETTAKLSDLKTDRTFGTSLIKIKSEVMKELVARGYYKANPMTVKTLWLVLGMAGTIAVSVLLGNLIGFLGILAGVLSGIVVIAFAFIMPARTQKGADAAAHIQGLEEYLTVAEKDRLKFHNAPEKFVEKTPEVFEMLLPFAIALGVEEAWAKQFKDLTSAPSWYNDSTGTSFNAGVFAGSMHHFSDSVQSAASSVTTASSGGSGFSGGGSGGGGGGGGGGSW